MEEQEAQLLAGLTDTQQNFIARNRFYLYDELTDENARKVIISLTSMAMTIVATANETGLIPCPIELHLDSPGGSLTAALAIVKCIEDIQNGESCKIGNVKVPIQVNTYIDGEADSGASLISICGSKRYCSKYAMSLIHAMRSADPQLLRVDDQRIALENNDKWNQIYKSIYLSKTKITQEKLDEIFKVEKYYTSQELLDFGCIDEII